MELRARLGEMLDAASAGERIVIERGHRPLAVLVSREDAERLAPKDERIARSLTALDRLEALRIRLHRRGPDAATAVRAERSRDDA